MLKRKSQRTIEELLESENYGQDTKVFDREFSQDRLRSLRAAANAGNMDPEELSKVFTGIELAESLMEKYLPGLELPESTQERLGVRLTKIKHAAERMPDVVRAAEDVVENIHSRIFRSYEAAVESGNSPDSYIVEYQSLRDALGDKFPGIERFELYINAQEVMAEVMPQLETLREEAAHFPESLQGYGRWKHTVVARLQHLTENSIRAWPESYPEAELKEATALAKQIDLIHANHRQLRAYRTSLVTGTQDLRARIDYLDNLGEELTETRVAEAINGLRGIEAIEPPIKTEFFQQEAAEYRQAVNDLNHLVGEITTQAQTDARNRYESIQKSKPKAKGIEELPGLLPILDSEVEELDELAAIFSLLGDGSFLAKAQQLRGQKASELQQASSTLAQKRVLDAELAQLGETQVQIVDLRKDISNYGVNRERLALLSELEASLERSDGKWAEQSSNEFLAPSIGHYQARISGIQGKLEAVKLQALHDLDAYVPRLAEHGDEEGINQVIQFYESFPEPVETRIMEARTALKSIQSPEDPAENAATYFRTLKPRSQAQNTLRHILDGRMDRTYLARLQTFMRHLEDTPSPSDAYETEFMVKLRRGVELMACSPIMVLELRTQPEGRQVINKALGCIDAYLQPVSS